MRGSVVEVSGKSGKLFLSLKWKAFLFTSFLLSGIFFGLIFSSHFYLKQQFETNLQESYQRHLKSFDALVNQTATRLQQLAGAVTAIEGMNLALESNDAAAINRAFDPYWWQLQLDSGIESASLFTDDNMLIAEWGVPNIPESLIVDTNTQERPFWAVNCWLSCEIYASVPLLVNGRKGGSIVFGAPFVDVVVDFKRLADADAGVAVKVEEGDASNQRYLADWGVNLIVLTQAQKNLGLLEKVSSLRPILSLEQQSHLIEEQGRFYEIRTIPLSMFAPQSRGYVLVLSDVTTKYLKLSDSLNASLFFGVLGLIVAELLVLLTLWGPMTRLRNTAELLPLLAQNAFDQLRSGLDRTQKPGRFIDESDVLSQTAIELSLQLQGLQAQLHRRAEQLQERGKELESERDFVTGLLNTAHALILTQDIQGKILMINRHGEWITGFAESELEGKRFLTLLPHNETLPDLTRQLEDLIIGKRNQLHHETDLITKDGEVIHVAWYHSRLTDRGTHGHRVLTIGLDISERKQAEDNLGWLASHDSLTGLLNRRRFNEDLERIIETNHRYQRVSARFVIDLDHFKEVNDISGHQVGDVLLKKVADILRQTARESDILARLGGDEFSVIVQEIDYETLQQTAQRFSSALSELEAVGEKQIHRVTGSIGVALIPEHGHSAEEALANADIAMYQAKESGRNGWHIFSYEEHDRERIHERVFWKEKVKRALSDDLMFIYYQPIMELATGNVSHYEALLRINDEDDKPYPTAKLILSTERSGLIHELDERVIEKVIAHKAALEIRGIQAKLSINLSGLSFRNTRLLSHIERCIKQLDVDPASIIFEITETAALADVEATSEIMRGVNNLGCKFALDDFGVGFSSLYYLKQLPIEYVKIDSSFIRHLHEDVDDQVLVKALVEVARAFGQFTIAEGVENQESLSWLKKLGVDYAQGYFISYPQSSETLWGKTVD
jgi:diguanylate cyclase (GGDEF)-like protein/PAS domain S-box-containing protein